MKPLLRSASLLAWQVLRPFFREVSGLGHVPPAGGCLLVANHRSVFDGLALAAVMNRLSRHTRFLSYAYLFDKPIVGTMLRLNRGIVLDETTSAGRERALDECRRLLRGGEVVGLFPEGHTAPQGRMLKAQPGRPCWRSKPAVRCCRSDSGARRRSCRERASCPVCAGAR
jgi:1-acyl-sn-glycerol-3-phosphate acyltransferase